MKMTKSLLLASAAIVLGMGVTTQAQAFDDVDWEWNKVVTNTENITITVNDTFDWSGLVEIEKIQANIGDVTATSTVTGIDNVPPSAGDGNGDGFVTIDDTFHIVTSTDDSTDPNTITPTALTPGDNGDLSGEVVGGTLDEGTDQLQIEFHVTGDVALEDVEEGFLDAVDLPQVVSAATAVANNQAIDSTTAINLHDAQYNFGGFGVEQDREGPSLEDLLIVGVGADQTDNAHTDAALGLTIAGALGLITPGSVTATSTVSDILNATVDSSATAVGNNMSVNIEPELQGDAFLIADLTQFNYADVSATSSVSDIDINNYANMGGAGFGNCGGCVIDGLHDGPQVPIVKSVATAVGNNVSISVGNFNVGE